MNYDLNVITNSNNWLISDYCNYAIVKTKNLTNYFLKFTNCDNIIDFVTSVPIVYKVNNKSLVETDEFQLSMEYNESSKMYTITGNQEFCFCVNRTNDIEFLRTIEPLNTQFNCNIIFSIFTKNWLFYDLTRVDKEVSTNANDNQYNCDSFHHYVFKNTWNFYDHSINVLKFYETDNGTTVDTDHLNSNYHLVYIDYKNNKFIVSSTKTSTAILNYSGELTETIIRDLQLNQFGFTQLMFIDSTNDCFSFRFNAGNVRRFKTPDGVYNYYDYFNNYSYVGNAYNTITTRLRYSLRFYSRIINNNSIYNRHILRNNINDSSTNNERITYLTDDTYNKPPMFIPDAPLDTIHHFFTVFVAAFIDFGDNPSALIKDPLNEITIDFKYY